MIETHILLFNLVDSGCDMNKMERYMHLFKFENSLFENVVWNCSEMEHKTHSMWKRKKRKGKKKGEKMYLFDVDLRLDIDVWKF